MAEIDPFVMALAAGLVMLAALVMLFGGIFETSLGSGQRPNVITTDIVSETGTKFVGLESVNSFKTIRFGPFKASKVMQTIGYDIQGKELKSGALFGSNDIVYTVSGDDISRAWLDFTVTETNMLEPLTILVNGKMIRSEKFTAGDHRIDIPEVSDVMEIRIVPVSSAFKIWAPTLYRLENVKVSIDRLSQEKTEYFFDIGDELDTLENARIDFSFSKAVGNIRILVNDNEIFNGPMRRQDYAEFGKLLLHRGTNTLAIIAGDQAVVEGSAVMNIFYLAAENERMNIPFRLTQEEYAAAESVRISFDVYDVKSEGGLKVSLVRAEQETFRSFDNIETKRYTYEIDKSLLRPGDNRLIVESIDAAFRVRNADVKLVRV